MLNAAQQAVFDLSANNFTLIPRDTASLGGAEGAAKDALAEGAQAIIGPLFAASIPGVKKVTEGTGVPVLALSTDTSLAEPGVYVLGLSPTGQVERIVDYAAHHGLLHLAIIRSETPYGTLVGQAFANAVAKSNAVLIADENISANRRDSGNEAAQRIIARRANIDAVLLPLSGDELASVLRGFQENVTQPNAQQPMPKLLGTGLWDDPQLVKHYPALAGAWFAAPDPAARQNFMTTYATTYGQEPPRVSTLAYDATALAAVLAKRGQGFGVNALTNTSGFAGLDGIFRLSPQGQVERGLAVLEAGANGPQVIDSAPKKF